MKQFKIAFKILFIGLMCIIPTPTYGKHGGFYKESSDKPIDEMDALFELHDNELNQAYNNWQRGINLANNRLLNSLNKVKIPTTFYGKMYLAWTKFIFKISTKI